MWPGYMAGEDAVYESVFQSICGEEPVDRSFDLSRTSMKLLGNECKTQSWSRYLLVPSIGVGTCFKVFGWNQEVTQQVGGACHQVFEPQE